LKEYTEASERDAFLEKELTDLEKSAESLMELIADLDVRLSTEFKSGVDKINAQFKEYFAVMFGGGEARLSVVVPTRRKKKDIDGLVGLEGRLIPISLAIKTYFANEQKKLDDLNATLEQVGVDMDSLKDEHGGEDGLLSEVIDNDKISKASVLKRIKEVKNSADDADELAVLEKYSALFEKEADTKKEIKDAEKDLEKKVLVKYPTFTEAEIKTLVVENKWMDELSAQVLGEIDRLSQTLTGRVKELAERYAEPIPEITKDVETLTKKVEDHLAKMGFKIK
jgi:type I restriction enzyme M protein